MKNKATLNLAAVSSTGLDSLEGGDPCRIKNRLSICLTAEV